MTTLADHSDLDSGDSGEEATLTDTDVAFIKVWDVVEAVDFVNAIHAAFFDHREGTTWAFLSWL